jgi:DNA-binding NtrC family response regulator
MTWIHSGKRDCSVHVSFSEHRRYDLAKILVADDEDSFRRFVSEVIKRNGHTPVEAGDGQEALERYKVQDIDLSIIDVNMPKMSGLDYLHAVKKLDPRAVVIIMTGYPTAETIVETIEEDGYTYIAKPIKIARLADLIQRGLYSREKRMRQEGS